MDNVAVIILAGGRGTRMNSQNTNKVMLSLGNKPMLCYTIDSIKKAGIEKTIVVVGFARDSIENYFQNSVSYAVQNNQKGTAHALSCGLENLPESYDTIISVYGDDSYIYPPQLYRKMIRLHNSQKADITILTVQVKNPTGLGRIVRNRNAHIIGIVEEKDATLVQRKIKEINTGFYVFNRKYVERNLTRIKNDNAAQEYYLTDIIDIATKEKRNIVSLFEKDLEWRGVNRPEELEDARSIISRQK